MPTTFATASMLRTCSSMDAANSLAFPGLLIWAVAARRSATAGSEATALMSAAIRSRAVRNLGEVDAFVRLAADDIRRNGFFTERGRTRSIVFTFLQLLDRWDRYAQRLGMERRAKPVTDIALALRDAEERR